MIKAEQRGIASSERDGQGELGGGVAFEWGLDPGYHPELENPEPLEGKWRAFEGGCVLVPSPSINCPSL